MKSLGEYLVDAGVMSRSDVDAAAAQIRGTQETLPTYLIRQGILTEELLVRTLSKEMRMPVLDLASFEVEASMASLFPVEFLREFCLLPVAIRKIGGKDHLIVAISSPLPERAGEWMRKNLHLPVRFGLAPERVIVERLRKIGVIPASAVQVLERFESEEKTQTASLNIKEEEDFEPTRVSRIGADWGRESENVIARLTEVHEASVQTMPEQAEMPPPSGVSRELHEFVSQTNKNLLLESLLQVLMDREILTLEEVMTAVELKK